MNFNLKYLNSDFLAKFIFCCFFFERTYLWRILRMPQVNENE